MQGMFICLDPLNGKNLKYYLLVLNNNWYRISRYFIGMFQSRIFLLHPRMYVWCSLVADNGRILIM